MLFGVCVTVIMTSLSKAAGSLVQFCLFEDNRQLAWVCKGRRYLIDCIMQTKQRFTQIKPALLEAIYNTSFTELRALKNTKSKLFVYKLFVPKIEMSNRALFNILTAVCESK